MTMTELMAGFKAQLQKQLRRTSSEKRRINHLVHQPATFSSETASPSIEVRIVYTKILTRPILFDSKSREFSAPRTTSAEPRVSY